MEFIIAAIISAAAAVYTVEEQKKSQKKAIKAAEEAQEKEEALYEQQAGEYVELTERQMKIQALQGQTKMLSELITSQESQRPVYTLPTAQPTSAVERINRAIGDLIKGRAA